MSGLGTHLKSLRTQAGLTPEQVAQRMECSRNFVYAIENKADMRISTALRYCQAIGAHITVGFPTKETQHELKRSLDEVIA